MQPILHSYGLVQTKLDKYTYIFKILPNNVKYSMKGMKLFIFYTHTYYIYVICSRLRGLPVLGDLVGGQLIIYKYIIYKIAFSKLHSLYLQLCLDLEGGFRTFLVGICSVIEFYLPSHNSSPEQKEYNFKGNFLNSTTNQTNPMVAWQTKISVFECVCWD